MSHRARAVSLAAVVAAIALAARGSAADPKEKRACESAYKSALERQQAGRLRAARESFQACARESCGARISLECTTKFMQLEGDIPSVVPVVTGDDGEPRLDVEVKVDGALLTSYLDGKALPVDPGVHEFSFSRGNEVFARRKLLILQGQRNRPIAVFEAASGDAMKARALVDALLVPKAPVAPREEAHPAPTKAAPLSGRSAFPYVLGGIGLASVGAGALLTYWGRKDNDALAACAPNCPASSVTHIKTLYLSADVAFAAGGAAIAGSALLLLFTGRSAERAPGSAALAVDVQPTRSGAFAYVSGAF